MQLQPWLSCSRTNILAFTVFLLMLAGVLTSQAQAPATLGNSGAITAAQRLRGLSQSQIGALIAAKKKALDDDPVAAIRRLVSLPPGKEQGAEFLGNLTALNATPGNAFLMVRETDCSLTAFNSAYTLSSDSTTYTPASKTLNFECRGGAYHDS
jgi:hypothetical protein